MSTAPLRQRLVENVFTGLARLRSGRALHTRGVVVAGRLTVDGGSLTGSALGGPGTRPVTVRLSRSLGTPQRLPDLLGLALRVPLGGAAPADGAATGAVLDILFASVGRHGATHMLLVPSRGWWSRPYSTVLPYRVDNDLLLLGLRPEPAGSPSALDLTEKPLFGPARTIGRLELRPARQAPATPTYDPVLNALPHLRPVRLLSGLREWAYTGSRRGRGAPKPEPPADPGAHVSR